MTEAPTIREIFCTFLRITLLAFGSAIAWMHRWSSKTVSKNKLGEALIRHVRRVYNLMIGERSAEEVKIKIRLGASPRDRVVDGYPR
jgi:actin-like ATPase involved in cell morphogenesis